VFVFWCHAGDLEFVQPQGQEGQEAPPVVDSWSIAMEKLGIPWTNPYFST
jgi:hypothetical protein